MALRRAFVRETAAKAASPKRNAKIVSRSDWHHGRPLRWRYRTAPFDIKRGSSAILLISTSAPLPRCCKTASRPRFPRGANNM